MERSNIIEMAKKLYAQAMVANSYYLVMMQYGKMQKEYSNEMEVSSAFYQVVYSALQEACIMDVSKLYDSSTEAVTLGLFLNQCHENIHVFPKNRRVETFEADGKIYTVTIPYQHRLTPEEERFFQEEVDRQREIFKLFDISAKEYMSVRVDLTFSEFLELYRKRFQSLSKKKGNLRVQRNKIYAHNDIDGNKFAKKFPITYSDIQEMIEFALDCTGMVLGVLTGVFCAREYSNIDDWERTLKLARLGLKYQHYDIEQRQQKHTEPMDE